MLTDPGELVFDPFAGSCVTGEVAERLKRKWICCENVEEYLAGALGRFENGEATLFPDLPENKHTKDISYKISHPSAMWNRLEDDPLPADGGRNRRLKSEAKYPDMHTKGKPLSVRERLARFRAKSKGKPQRKQNHP
jgi:site-specific DNA-methyltransferase (cytosine-N4-specific)